MDIDGSADRKKRKASIEQDVASKRKRVSRACDRCRIKKGVALETAYWNAQANVSKINAMEHVQAVQHVGL
jgi:hypothetical protein